MSLLRDMDREARQRLFCRLARPCRFDARELASECQVSQRQLNRYFADDFARSPQEWLNEQRMLAAAHLLVQEQSVKVTALTLGYSRTNNFSREFHRVHGLSPRQFLQRWNERTSRSLSDTKCPYLIANLPCPLCGFF